MRWMRIACCLLAPSYACGSSGGVGSASSTGPTGASATGTSGGAASAGSGSTSTGSRSAGSASASSGSRSAGSTASSTGSGTSSTSAGDGGAGQGSPWLYTKGNKIYASDGKGGGTPWMGRGVNVDDIFLCGGNSALSMSNAEQTLEAIVAGAITDWKASFLRVSLSMASMATKVSWLTDAAQYKTPMTNVIHSIGAHPGVYVLVTLRSDTTMVETNAGNEATYVPQASTDAVYTALVDSFAQDPYVLFGVTNEPGTIASATLTSTMQHAVATIRAEEDKLGTPHHLISVQGSSWDQDIGFYGAAPLTGDNIVYEFHYYPVNQTTPASYTYANLPVIVAEYGMDPVQDAAKLAAFYADAEARQVPNLAWDFEPYSNCAPDLVAVTGSAATLTPTAWGTAVKAYLTSH